MRTLYLSLPVQQYEMVESGVITEVYREIEQYWCNTLYRNKDSTTKEFKPYTQVVFLYNYTKRTMTFEIESIRIGKGNPEWGAPTEDVFIIKPGKRIKQN